MHARRSKISHVAALCCALSPVLAPTLARAQDQSAPDPCLTDERCNSYYEAALSLSKAGQFSAALSNYQDAYTRRPAPWLLINIGRVLQKMGRPKDALASYQKFLDTAGEQADPELLVTARQYSKQAAQDMANPKGPKVIVMKEEQGPRPVWRLLLGSALLVGGVGMLVPGAYNLAVNGRCVDDPVPPVQTCPTIYSGVAAGAPLTALGIVSIASGIVTIAIPGKRVYRPVPAAPEQSPP